MRINYEDPEVVARQNIAPNAGCDIDGVFYDMRNCVHLLNEQADRIEELSNCVAVLEAKLTKAMSALSEHSTARCFGKGEVLGLNLSDSPMGREVLARMEHARTTLAELKGETDE
jgi:hypothetical protein